MLRGVPMPRSSWCQVILCLCAAFAFAVVGLTGPSVATAASGSESAEYRSVVNRAVQEFEAGNYAEARGLFVRAHEIYPNARTYRGLGLVAFELRHYAVAIDYLTSALDSNERPLTAAHRASTEEALEKARGYIAVLELKTEPSTARVLVDGIVVEHGDGGPLVLEVGDRTLEVQASGYIGDRRVLSIAGRERLNFTVELPRLQAAGLPAAGGALEHRDESAPRSRRWYKNPWLWTGLAVVAAGAGAGLAFALRPEAKTKTDETSHLPNMPANGGTLAALGSW
ncbi:MAG: hypothetical protein JWN04_3565 [Myxococcaceae bacterium]|nr:hypothetical protein [Myxococcaceae bacterium]